MYEYRKRESKFKKIISLIFLVIVVAASSVFIYSMYTDIDVYSTDENNNVAVRLSQNESKKEEQNITEVLESVTKSVVGISKIKNKGNSIFLNNSASDLGLGTGMIVSENGYILTNWHVAGNKYSNCYITLENGKSYNGSVAWADSDLDLAIVKINATGLQYLNLGDSDNVKLGQTTYAIGNPIGVEFQRTVTSGIISGVNRTIKIGFAVPINIVKPIIESFVRNGNFEEAYLGIFAYDKNVVPYLETGIEFGSGIYVAQINKDGPANTSNLKVGDIITKIDDIDINKMSELRKYIYSKKAGDEVNLIVLRNKKTYSIKIKLGKK